jgi:hypothetical protein
MGWRTLRPAASHADRTCVELPFGSARPSDLAPAGSRDDDPLRYAVIRIEVEQAPERPSPSLQAHLYDLGPARGFVLVGLERLEAGESGD